MLRGMPKPRPDIDTEPYWRAVAEQRLVIPRCLDCGYLRWPPGPCCPRCQSFSTDWVRASGEGHVYSWTVVRHPTAEVLLDQVPYIIVLVDLAEGARVLGNLVDCDPSLVAPQMAVSVIFERDSAGFSLPNFVASPVSR